MPHRIPDDIVSKGKAIYEGLRAQLEQTDWGKFAVIDVYSGDYEVDTRDAEATARLLSRRPDAMTYGIRIGDTVAVRFRAYGKETIRGEVTEDHVARLRLQIADAEGMPTEVVFTVDNWMHW